VQDKIVLQRTQAIAATHAGRRPQSADWCVLLVQI
jgi:hypothetical protein